MRQPELVDRPAFTRTEGGRLPEGQELDGGRATPDELRCHRHVGEFHELGELGADGVRFGLLETQGLAVEAQRPLQVAHADAEVREGRFEGVVHGVSLPGSGPGWPRDPEPS